MKFKKYSYLIAFVLMLLIGINGVEAKVNKTCYYLEGTKKSMIKFEIRDGSVSAGNFNPFNGNLFNADKSWEKNYSAAYVNKLGKRIDNDTEAVLNWYKNYSDDVTGMTLNKINSSKSAAASTKTCPEYLMVRTNNKYSSYGVFASNSETVATQFVEKSDNKGGYKTWYLTYKNEDGSEITSEEYYDTFITTPESIYDPDATITCDQLFGDRKDDGEANDVNRDGIASIAYMVDSVLQYVRVIIPILVIILGVIDLAKAVISSKEDEMRKAQLTFIKRLLLGLVVFFVPLIVNVIMELADLVWESAGYSSCEFR